MRYCLAMEYAEQGDLGAWLEREGAQTERFVRRELAAIAGALDALGDDWSVLVLRELFFGVRRFNEIQEDLGISRSVLTEGLLRLVDLGVVRVAPYREPGQRERNEYRLTRAGVGLLPSHGRADAMG